MKHNYESRRWNSLSIIWKLRLSFFFLIALFILLLTLLSHTTFKRIFSNRKLEEYNTRITLVDVACEDLISYAQQFSKLLLLSDEIQDYFNIDSTSSYADTIIKERNAEIRFDYVQGNRKDNEFSLIAAYNDSLNSIVLSKDMSPNKKSSYLQFYKEKVINSERSAWIPVSISGDSQICLCYSSPYFDFKTGNKIGHLVIFYDLESLQTLLHPLFSSTISQYSVISDDALILSSEDITSDFNIGITKNITNIDSALDKAKNMGYWVEYHSIPNLPFTILSYEPGKIMFQDINTMDRMIVFTGLLLIIIAAVISSKIADSFTKPIILLTEAMHQFSKGGNVEVDSRREDEIGVLEKSFNAMTKQINNLIQQVYDEQRKRRKFELNALQAQINPHFLYNTLNSICSLIVLKKNSEAYRMITDLSSFYRTALSNGQILIPLSDELKNVESYLHIQSIRTSNSFSWFIKTDPELKNQQIVKLTLQPLVENSILHAFNNREENNLLSIDCHVMNSNHFCITISDNGNGIPEDKISHIFDQDYEKFGLYSVRERLRIYFDNEADLTVSSQYGLGTTFTITLPRKESVGGYINDQDNVN